MPTQQHPEEIGGSTVFRTGLHPMSLAGGGAGAIVTLLIAWMIVRHNDLAPEAVLQAAIYGTATACVWLIGPALRFVGFEVAVAADEVVVIPRPLSGPRSARLDEIEGVVEHSGSLGRHLGYGTVVIYGRGGTGATLRHVRDAERLCRTLLARAKRAGGRRA